MMTSIAESGSGCVGPRQCNDWATRRIVPLHNQGGVVENQRLIALGQLTAGVIHDLKNFCGQVKGLQFLASRNLKAENYEKTGEYLGLIDHSVDSIVSLCDSMLEFGSSKVGRVESMLLIKAVKDVVMMATTTLSGIDHEVCDRYVGSRVAINAFQFQQILLNLIRNARQALQDSEVIGGEKGGKITILIHPMHRESDERILECSEPDFYVGISIDDTGIGMSEEVLSQIAKPFFTTKPVGDGTGLGLFMSAHLADLHGGALIVKTRHGVGTRVTLCLPVVR